MRIHFMQQLLDLFHSFFLIKIWISPCCLYCRLIFEIGNLMASITMLLQLIFREFLICFFSSYISLCIGATFNLVALWSPYDLLGNSLNFSLSIYMKWSNTLQLWLSMSIVSQWYLVFSSLWNPTYLNCSMILIVKFFFVNSWWDIRTPTWIETLWIRI